LLKELFVVDFLKCEVAISVELERTENFLDLVFCYFAAVGYECPVNVLFLEIGDVFTEGLHHSTLV
jgi:hypothetical protein